MFLAFEIIFFGYMFVPSGGLYWLSKGNWFQYGATVGIGLPIMNGWNGKSIVNISGQAVHVRPNVPGMITENYLRLSVGLSFNEGWFDKWKVQ